MNHIISLHRPVDLLDAWIRSMLPESDRNANTMAGLCGLLALLIGFQASRMHWEINDGIFVNPETGKVEVSTHLNPAKPKPVLPPAHKAEKPKPVLADKADSKPAGNETNVLKTKEYTGHGAAGVGFKGVLEMARDAQHSSSMSVEKLMGTSVITALNTTLKSALMIHSNVGVSGSRRGKSDFGQGAIGNQLGNWGNSDHGAGGLGGPSGRGFGDGLGDNGFGSLGHGQHGTGLGSVVVPKSAEIEYAEGDGGRSKMDIMRIVRARTGGLRYILSHYLRNGFSGGTIQMRLVIAPSGEVVGTEILKSSTGIDGFDQEIANKVKEWNFGTALNAGNTTVTIPLTFGD